ncbi:uncharacterized protein LOC119831084 [Zerene cesonia]|uniref:uncharacterized protein LOC119831084 n=1 Tax=Zerene cesonia TaxID=33412 RepID=UPI0018E4FDDA|nr:uncharacterized protein LOC119831084 [Zerene cesonia]
MFVHKFVLLGTLIVNIVLSEEIDDDIRVNVHRPKQLSTYAYNHPPLFESPDDIFVGQKEVVRKAKSVESTQEPADRRDREIGVVYENTASEKIPNTAENKTRRRKQRRRQHSSTNTTPSDNLTRSYTKNEKLNKEKLITTPTPALLEAVKTTSSPSRDVTLFPKRPIEDSKRIEFQRQGRTRTPAVKILDSSNFVYSHTGNFHYSYDSADGTKVSSRGELRNVNEGTGEAVEGNVFYTDKEGNDFSLSYTADENGYRPVGAHLPTPPPIPPAIARALRYLATKKPDDVTEIPEKKSVN